MCYCVTHDMDHYVVPGDTVYRTCGYSVSSVGTSSKTRVKDPHLVSKQFTKEQRTMCESVSPFV
jgi:hypothetical protein